MASELIARSAFGLMGYWPRAHSGARNNVNYARYAVVLCGLLTQSPFGLEE